MQLMCHFPIIKEDQKKDIKNAFIQVKHNEETENLNTQNFQNTEELGLALKPLAASLAQLAEHQLQATRNLEIEMSHQSEMLTEMYKINKATVLQQKQNQQSQYKINLMWAGSTVFTSLILSLFFLWLMPSPVIQNQLDSKAVAKVILKQMQNQSSHKPR